MYNEQAFQLISSFIKSRLKGDLYSLVDFNLALLRGDEEFECSGRKFDPDDSSPIRTVYCVVLGDVWKNLTLENLGDGK